MSWIRCPLLGRYVTWNDSWTTEYCSFKRILSTSFSLSSTPPWPSFPRLWWWREPSPYCQKVTFELAFFWFPEFLFQQCLLHTYRYSGWYRASGAGGGGGGWDFAPSCAALVYTWVFDELCFRYPPEKVAARFYPALIYSVLSCRLFLLDPFILFL